MRITVLGAPPTSLKLRGVSLKTTSWDEAWEDEGASLHLQDQDLLILNFGEWSEDDADTIGGAFHDILTPSAVRDILIAKGTVVILGSVSAIEKESGDNITGWIDFDLGWEHGAGAVIKATSEDSHPLFTSFISKTKRFEGSLSWAELDLSSDSVYAPRTESLRTHRYGLIQRNYAVTKAGRPVAFSLQLVSSVTGLLPPVSTAKDELGSVFFLPQPDLPWEEAFRIIVEEFAGNTGANVPTWVATLTAPGQSEIDSAISAAEGRLRQIEAELEFLRDERGSVRAILALLYETGPPLEEIVWSALEELGATVERPLAKVNKEDGWISVAIGGVVKEGVLEIKSTAKKQHSIEGIRQAGEWKTRTANERLRLFKPIFIGSAMVKAEPTAREDPFADDFVKTAKIHGAAALRAEDLYYAIVAKHENRLDRDAFWSRVFESEGVVDVSDLV